jgi:uncharacterized membrane protein
VKHKVLALAGTALALFVVANSLRGRRYTGIKLKKSIIIDRSAAELYAFWRNFPNLARLANILESVEAIDDIHSRWTVAAPGHVPVQWDAEITKDIPDEMIGWRSIEGSPIETAGYVRFEPTAGHRGTLIRVALEYDLPASRVGAAVAALFGKRPGAHIEELLRRLKQVMEAGEPAVSGYVPPSERVAS